MKRPGRAGITFTETLVAISILIALGAIATPVYLSTRAESSKAHCMSNLHQIGLAVHLYRTEYGGDGNYGNPDAMGLPRMFPGGFKELVKSTTAEVWKCNEQLPFPGGRLPQTSYIRIYPDDPEKEPWNQFAQQARAYGDAIVLFVDANHNSAHVVHGPLYPKLGLGLRLDGAVRKRKRAGAIFAQEWWQD